MKDYIDKFAEALEIEDASSLNGNTQFRDLEEWNSLAVLSLIALYDEEYGVELSPAAIKSCNTLEDLYKLTK